MKKLILSGTLLANVVLFAAPADSSSDSRNSEQLLREQKHFLECLAVVYHPAFWFSYNGALYFQPKTEAQSEQIDTMKTARARYVAFTDRRARHALAAEAMSEGGISESQQLKILLPYSEWNANLTPTHVKPIRVLDRYQVLQSLGGGDALLQAGEKIYFVMNFGRGSGDGSGTNACLFREGTKTYTTADDQKHTVDAFTNVALSREEIEVLVQASTSFRKKAEAISQELGGFKARRDFADSLARADDRNPFLQYQVAAAYLDGRGTPKDEKLGLEWMHRAAQNGSGDAKAYLAEHGEGDGK